MGITFGFFNSIGDDRTYDAVQMSSMFDGIIMDGVFASILPALAVTPGTDMHVIVGAGKAWFNHTWTVNDAPLVLPIEAAHVILQRIDAVVLEINSSEAVRANTIKVITGTPGNPALKPTWTNTNEVHTYPLAYISVPSQSTAIIQGMIETKIGTAECPYVVGPLVTVNVNNLFSQWTLEFQTWFNLMKEQLSTDAAGNLQLEIDQLPKIIARQGHASEPDWSFFGLTTYLNPTGKLQLGNHMGPADAEFVTVDFPIPFTARPVVFCQSDANAGFGMLSLRIIDVTTTYFKVEQYTHSFADGSKPVIGIASVLTFNWLAIGPVS